MPMLLRSGSLREPIHSKIQLHFWDVVFVFLPKLSGYNLIDGFIYLMYLKYLFNCTNFQT